MPPAVKKHKQKKKESIIRVPMEEPERRSPSQESVVSLHPERESSFDQCEKPATPSYSPEREKVKKNTTKKVSATSSRDVRYIREKSRSITPSIPEATTWSTNSQSRQKRPRSKSPEHTTYTSTHSTWSNRRKMCRYGQTCRDGPKRCQYYHPRHH